MKFALFLACAAVMDAQSNPAWWKYTPPGATAVVGIHWENLRETLFAPAIAAEFIPGGSLGFPDLEILRNPEQILLAAPALVVVEYGDFPAATVRQQAGAKGMKKSSFKGVEMWLASTAGLAIALVSPKIVLVGNKAALQEAIERGADTDKARPYSPLLARAARYAKEDLWVVASSLPDNLASRFLPVEMEATAFEGSVSVWDGLHMVAAIERPSPTRALDLADSLVESLATRPAMAQATEVSTRDRSVMIAMDLNETQLMASLRAPEPTSAAAALATKPTVTAAATAPAKAQPRAANPTPAAVTGTTPNTEVAAAAPVPQTAASLPPAPARPKVIRILGMGDGPIEIPVGH
ncbi:MAG: hypothetical protein ABI995_14130 [Acidobacteriota bacterium]